MKHINTHVTRLPERGERREVRRGEERERKGGGEGEREVQKNNGRKCGPKHPEFDEKESSYLRISLNLRKDKHKEIHI